MHNVDGTTEESVAPQRRFAKHHEYVFERLSKQRKELRFEPRDDRSFRRREIHCSRFSKPIGATCKNLAGNLEWMAIGDNSFVRRMVCFESTRHGTTREAKHSTCFRRCAPLVLL